MAKAQTPGLVDQRSDRRVSAHVTGKDPPTRSRGLLPERDIVSKGEGGI